MTTRRHTCTSHGLLKTGWLLLLLACNPVPPPAADEATRTPAPANDRKGLAKDFDALLKRAEDAVAREDRILATQLVARGLADTAEAGRDFEEYRAGFLLLKGQLAFAGAAVNDARRFLGDAMAIYQVTDNDAGICRVNLALALLEDSIGDTATAARHLETASALVKKKDDPPMEARHAMVRGTLALSRMDYADAATAFAEAIRLFGAIEDRRAEAAASLKLAAAQDAKGDVRNADRTLNRALQLFRDLHDQAGEARVLHRLALMAAENGNHGRARDLFKKVEQLYIALGQPGDAARVSQHVSALPE